VSGKGLAEGGACRRGRKRTREWGCRAPV